MTATTSKISKASKAPSNGPAKVAGKRTAGSKAKASTPVTPGKGAPQFAEAFIARLDTLRGHAVTCGKLDCGHLYKSDSQAVRRAVILYTAENSGQGFVLDLSHETPETVAVLGVLRTAKHGHPVYSKTGARGGMVAHTAGITTIWPDASRIRMTPERVSVFGYLLAGYSATQISSDPNRVTAGKANPRKGLTARALATVVSHAGYLRRETDAHDAVSALLCLVKAGKLTDKGIGVKSAAVRTPKAKAPKVTPAVETPAVSLDKAPSLADTLAEASELGMIR